MTSLRCPNKGCHHAPIARVGNIIRDGLYKTAWGKRRRYRYPICGKIFCLNLGTPYYPLQRLREAFDELLLSASKFCISLQSLEYRDSAGILSIADSRPWVPAGPAVSPGYTAGTQSDESLKAASMDDACQAGSLWESTAHGTWVLGQVRMLRVQHGLAGTMPRLPHTGDGDRRLPEFRPPSLSPAAVPREARARPFPGPNAFLPCGSSPRKIAKFAADALPRAGRRQSDPINSPGRGIDRARQAPHEPLHFDGLASHGHPHRRSIS